MSEVPIQPPCLVLVVATSAYFCERYVVLTVTAEHINWDLCNEVIQVLVSDTVGVLMRTNYQLRDSDQCRLLELPILSGCAASDREELSDQVCQIADATASFKCVEAIGFLRLFYGVFLGISP